MRGIRGLVLLVLALGSFARSFEWVDDVTVWQVASVRHPESPRAWLNRCAIEQVSDWCYRGWRAALAYDEATQRQAEAVALVNLSLLAAQHGDRAAASIFAQRLVQRFPQWQQGRLVCNALSCDSALSSDWP
jgi:hypothetical protein